MAEILVRNLDEEVVQRLKDRARTGGRSLQAEARMILEQAAKVDMAMARKLLDRFRARLGNRKLADSATLIREDRDR